MLCMMKKRQDLRLVYLIILISAIIVLGYFLISYNLDKKDVRLSVGKIPGQIIINSTLFEVYNATPKNVSFRTIPAGLNVTITYNDSLIPPTNASIYLVNITINDSIHEGSNISLLVISKANQTITFNQISDKNLSEEFDLNASSSSGLLVSFNITSGPANLSGLRLNITGSGAIVVTAKQNGNDNYNPALEVNRTINLVCGSGFVRVGDECKAICTNFTYSNWSICYSNNTQIRTIVASTPLSCVLGSPALNQSCVRVCEPDSTLACDSVNDSVVTGYKNKCNSLGTNYTNESTCSIRKNNLKRNDLSIGSESNKKNIRDSNGQLIMRIPSILDNSILDDIDILRSNLSETKQFIIVRNLSLAGQTKTLIFERKNSNSNAVCIRDESNLRNKNEILSNCFKVKCPGKVGDYNCTLTGNTFEVSGLEHSGVIEDRLFCGDDLCSEGESCSSCRVDCGACGSSGSNSNNNGGNSFNSGSGNNTVINNNSTVRTNTNQTINQQSNNLKKKASKNENSNIINYVVGFLILIVVIILAILFIIFIRSQKTNYVPDKNNSIFDRKVY